uniref:CCHC-type domain-containing protein n=1 Tax=Panagrolaimus davidi TaxID=227884 RepID=A0A914Q4Q4_9BILA
MSGPIRRKLGPMVARLKRYIDTAEQEVAPVDATGEVEEKELRRLMKESLNKLTSCSTQVNAEMNKWTDYISRLPQTERITEEKTYETFDDTTNLSEYLDKSTELIDTLKALLAELDDNSDEEDDESTKTDSNQTADTKALAKEDSTTTTYKIRQDIIKLPSIEIKNFNGNHLEFDAFKEAFDAVIDSQPLPPVVKLNYLMNYLEGPAKRSVEGYRIIGSNYDTVRQELSKRFGKMDEIKASLHAELDNLKPAPEGNVHALRNVIESINRVIRQMEAHGEIIDHPHIYTAIMKKIPKSTLKLLLEEKAKSKEWNYSRINEELERIVSLQEAVDRAYAENHAQQLDTQSSQYTTPRATVMSINRAPKTPCSFCNRSHWSQECRTYPAGQSRENRIRELGYCYKCLQTGHYSNKCTKRMVCRLCNRAHHTATCRQDPNYNRNQRRTSQPQQQYQQNRQTPYHQQNRSQNQGQQRQRSNSWSNPSSQQDNRAPQQQQQRQNQQRNQRYVNQKIDQPNIPASLQPRQVHFAHQDEEEISPATGSNRIPLGPARETESNAFSTNSTDHQAMMLTMNLAVYDPARPEEKLNLLAFFDTGSDYSYISSEAMAQLAVPLSDPKTLSLFTFGQQTPQLVETEKCHIGVTTPEGEIELKLRTMPYLTHQIKTVVMDGEKPVVTQVQPQLLIGNDYFWEIISGNPKQLENGFFELDTIFGPLLCGKREKAAVEKFERTITTITTEETEDPDIKQFWSLEGIGITEEEANSDDQTAINFFKQTVQQKDDGRYVVRWPLKEEISTLPHNYNTAFRRLQQTLHRLKKATDPSLIEKYNKTLLDQLKMGITEDVTESTPNGPLHYLPHLPILTPDKTTTKLRVVFDASAKTSNGKCLNDYLLRGPILLPDICGNLLRFRIPKIAIVADVEKAFLQVEIHPDDRDLTRFLWVKDPTKPLTEDNLRVLRYLRVKFC